MELFDGVIGVLIENSSWRKFSHSSSCRLVIINLKLGLQLSSINLLMGDTPNAICKLSNCRPQSADETCMVVANRPMIYLWSLKLTNKTSGVVRVVGEQLKEIRTTISHRHVLFEMQNGWLVDGRGYTLHLLRERSADIVPLWIVWDLETDKCVQIINESKDDMVFGIAELKDKQIVTSCVKNVRCWEVVSGQEMWSIDTQPLSSFHSTNFHGSGSGKEMIGLSDATLFFSNLEMIDLKTREISRGSTHFKGTKLIKMRNGTVAVINSYSATRSLFLFRIPTK